MNSNHLNALLIFAKWPVPGKVKTRLAPPLATQEAVDLYRCMLLDTLESTATLSEVRRMIFFDGKSERSADFRLLAPDAEVVMQEGTDLGERLSKAFDRAFAAGCSSVAIIGTDFPHMPVKRIEETFHLLNHNKADAVFGPSEDGGYYLVAMNKLHPGLFRDIPWSSPDTLARSLAKAASLKLTAELLTPGFDLDTVGDLLRLKKETLPVAPRTLSFLSRIMP